MLINITINTSTHEVNVSVPREFATYNILEVINAVLISAITPVLVKLDAKLRKVTIDGEKNSDA